MAFISISGPDPLASVTALLNFFCTPAGQDVIEDLRKVNQVIVTKIGDMAGVVHSHAMALPAPVADPAPKT